MGNQTGIRCQFSGRHIGCMLSIRGQVRLIERDQRLEGPKGTQE